MAENAPEPGAQDNLGRVVSGIGDLTGVASQMMGKTTQVHTAVNRSNQKLDEMVRAINELKSKLGSTSGEISESQAKGWVDQIVGELQSLKSSKGGGNGGKGEVVAAVKSLESVLISCCRDLGALRSKAFSASGINVTVQGLGSGAVGSLKQAMRQMPKPQKPQEVLKTASREAKGGVTTTTDRTAIPKKEKAEVMEDAGKKVAGAAGAAAGVAAKAAGGFLSKILNLFGLDIGEFFSGLLTDPIRFAQDMNVEAFKTLGIYKSSGSEATSTAIEMQKYSESMRISGLKTHEHMQMFTKTLSKGMTHYSAQDQALYKNRFKSEKGLEAYNFRRIAAARQLVENAGTVASLTGASAETTLTMFTEWNQTLGMSSSTLGSISLQTHQIAEDFGLAGAEMDRVLATTNQIVKVMADAGTLTANATQNMMRTTAAMQKYGVESKWLEIANAMASHKGWADADKNTQRFLFQMINRGARGEEGRTAEQGREQMTTQLISGTGMEDIRVQQTIARGMKEELTATLKGTLGGDLEGTIKGMGLKVDHFMEGGEFRPEKLTEFMEALRAAGKDTKALDIQRLIQDQFKMGAGEFSRMGLAMAEASKPVVEKLKDLKMAIASQVEGSEEQKRFINTKNATEYQALERLLKMKAELQKRHNMNTLEGQQLYQAALVDGIKKGGLEGLAGVQGGAEGMAAATEDPAALTNVMIDALASQAKNLGMTAEGGKGGAGATFGKEGLDIMVGGEKQNIKSFEALKAELAKAPPGSQEQRDLLDFSNQLQKKVLNYAKDEADPMRSLARDMRWVKGALQELIGSKYIEWIGIIVEKIKAIWTFFTSGGIIGKIFLAIGALWALFKVGGFIFGFLSIIPTLIVGIVSGISAAFTGLIGLLPGLITFLSGPFLPLLAAGLGIAAIVVGGKKIYDTIVETNQINEAHKASAKAGNERQKRFNATFQKRDKDNIDRLAEALKKAKEGGDAGEILAAQRAIAAELKAQTTSNKNRATQLAGSKKHLANIESDISDQRWSLNPLVQGMRMTGMHGGIKAGKIARESSKETIEIQKKHLLAQQKATGLSSRKLDEAMKLGIEERLKAQGKWDTTKWKDYTAMVQAEFNKRIGASEQSANMQAAREGGGGFTKDLKLDYTDIIIALKEQGKGAGSAREAGRIFGIYRDKYLKGGVLSKEEKALMLKWVKVDPTSWVKGGKSTLAGAEHAKQLKNQSMINESWNELAKLRVSNPAMFEAGGKYGAGSERLAGFTEKSRTTDSVRAAKHGMKGEYAISEAQSNAAYWDIKNRLLMEDAIKRMKLLEEQNKSEVRVQQMRQGFYEKDGEKIKLGADRQKALLSNLKSVFNKMEAAQVLVEKSGTEAQKTAMAEAVALAKFRYEESLKYSKLKDADRSAAYKQFQADQAAKAALEAQAIKDRAELDRKATVAGLNEASQARLDENAKLLKQIESGRYMEMGKWVQMTAEKESEMLNQIRSNLTLSEHAMKGEHAGPGGRIMQTKLTTPEQEALTALNNKVKEQLVQAQGMTELSIEERKKIQAEARIQEKMQEQTNQIVSALTDVKLAVQGETEKMELARKAAAKDASKQLTATENANIDSVVKAVLPIAAATETMAEALAKQEGTPVQGQRFQDWSNIQSGKGFEFKESKLSKASSGNIRLNLIRKQKRLWQAEQMEKYKAKYGSAEPPASIQAFREKMKNAQIVQPINIEGAKEGARMLKDGIILAHKGELIVPAEFGAGKIGASEFARMHAAGSGFGAGKIGASEFARMHAAGSKANEDSGDTYEERRSREGRANCDCIDKLIAAQERREERDNAYKGKMLIMQLGAFGKREVEAAHEFDQLEKISAIMVGGIASPMDIIAKTVVGTSEKVETLLGGIMAIVQQIAHKLLSGSLNEAQGIAYKILKASHEKNQWERIKESMKSAPGMGLFDKGMGAEANERGGHTTERLLEAQESQIKESEKQVNIIAKALGMFDPEKSKEAAETFDKSTIAMQKIMKDKFSSSGSELKTIVETIMSASPLGGIEINRDHFDNEDIRKGFISTAGLTDSDVDERFQREKAGTGGGVGGVSMGSIDKYLTQVQAGYFQAMISELEEIKENTKSSKTPITRGVGTPDPMSVRGHGQQALDWEHNEANYGFWDLEPAGMQPGLQQRSDRKNDVMLT